MFVLLLAALLVAAWGPAVQAGPDKVRTEESFEFDADHPRPFLGVTLQDADGDADGVRVLGVIGGSAAEAAGLQAGDLIVGIDGADVSGSWDLTRRLLGSEVGQRVDLDVIRDGERLDLRAELGQRDNVFELEHLEEQMGQLERQLQKLDVHMRHVGQGRPKLGVQLVEATPELREHLGGSPDAGVLVGKVIADMPAEAGGIEVGDLIVAVNGESVADTGDLLRALRDVDGQTIEVDVIRDGRNRSFDVVIPPRDED